MEKQLITIPELGEILSIGRSKAYELIDSGELQVVRIGRAVRVTTASVHEYVRRLAERGDQRG